MRIARIHWVFFVLATALALSGCTYTRHKKGADAFEHYFGVKPPSGVMLRQAHWAGLYYPFGLDAEQMLLEFSAAPATIAELLGDNPTTETASTSAEQREKIFSWHATDAETVKDALAHAPGWFRPVDPAGYALSFPNRAAAWVRFANPAGRFEFMVYDHGDGLIFVDRKAGLVFVTQPRGGNLF